MSLDSLTFVDEKGIDRASSGAPSGFPAELLPISIWNFGTPPANEIVEDDEDLSTGGPKDLDNLPFPSEVCG